MHEHREVRVTARKSVRTPFAPADLSPVQAHLLIDDHGKPGWTDMDVKVTDVTGDHKPSGLVERSIQEMSAGTPVRRREPARKARVMNTTGPSARYQAMKAAAERLAAQA